MAYLNFRNVETKQLSEEWTECEHVLEQKKRAYDDLIVEHALAGMWAAVLMVIIFFFVAVIVYVQWGANAFEALQSMPGHVARDRTYGFALLLLITAAAIGFFRWAHADKRRELAELAFRKQAIEQELEKRHKMLYGR